VFEVIYIILSDKCNSIEMYKYVLIFAVVLLASNAYGSEECANSENPVACRGINFLSKAFNQVITNNNDETLKLLPGLEIVENENVNKVNTVNDERSITEQNETVFTKIAKYLQTHDLKIKFSDMVGKTDLQEVINNVFNNDDPALVGENFFEIGCEFFFMCDKCNRTLFTSLI
jgi:hypothetical protein